MPQRSKKTDAKENKKRGDRGTANRVSSFMHGKKRFKYWEVGSVTPFRPFLGNIVMVLKNTPKMTRKGAVF